MRYAIAILLLLMPVYCIAQDAATQSIGMASVSGLTLPSQTGKSGWVLSTDGANAAWKNAYVNTFFPDDPAHGATIGDTTSDQDGINSAMTDAFNLGGGHSYLETSGYGVVIIRPGKYYFSGPIDAKSNIKVIATGCTFIPVNNYSGAFLRFRGMVNNFHWIDGAAGCDNCLNTTRTWNLIDVLFTDLNTSYGMYNTVENLKAENCNIGASIVITGTGWWNFNHLLNIDLWRPVIGLHQRTPADGQISKNEYLNWRVQTHSSYTTFSIDTLQGAYNTMTGMCADMAGSTRTVLGGTKNSLMGAWGIPGSYCTITATTYKYDCVEDGKTYYGYGQGIQLYNIVIKHTAAIGVEIVGGGLKANSLLLNPSAAPGSPSEGWVYPNSTDHHLYFWNGTAWKQLDN